MKKGQKDVCTQGRMVEDGQSEGQGQLVGWSSSPLKPPFPSCLALNKWPKQSFLPLRTLPPALA